MSDGQKKLAIIVFVVAAIAIAIFSVTRTITADMPHNAGPLGGKASNGGGKGTLPEGKEQ